MSDSPEPQPIPRESRFQTAVLILLGVVLPSITLAFELRTGMSADGYLDPVPTLWHALAVAFVPAANLAALLAARRPGARLGLIRLMLGAAIAIAACYSLLYAPAMPMALLAVAMMGMGLLPLAPAFSLLSALALLGRLRRPPTSLASRPRWPHPRRPRSPSVVGVS